LQCQGRKRRFGLSPRSRGACRVAVMVFNSPTKREDQWEHCNEAEQPDADMSSAPTRCRNEMLYNRRPDRAGNIIARRCDGDSNAAALNEPV